tara:strand:- start:150 stop:653 length:504 start_codon:yes stop_codon:yes gene_type:complete
MTISRFPVKEEMQGFADYNDSATASTPIVLPSNTWVAITNNEAGASTNTAYLPRGVDSLFSGNKIDPRQLELGDALIVRYDFTLTPNINGAFVEIRMTLGTGAGSYSLPRPVGTLSNGAGYAYKTTGEFYLYMGDENTRDNLIGLEVQCSEDGSLTNAGMVIQVLRQ